MTATFVFPHQLYEQSAAVDAAEQVFLIESDLYFSQYRFHQQKILLHRASMKFYEDYLQSKGKQVHYITFQEQLSTVVAKAKNLGVQIIHYTATNDFLLEKRLQRYAQQHEIALIQYESPNFLNSAQEILQALKEDKKYFLTSFYIKQRKKLGILLDKDGKPEGNQWTFDTENRKKLPKNIILPKNLQLTENQWVKAGKTYVQAHFGHHYGQLSPFNYPTTYAETQQVLENFLATKLHLFGDYEDAIARHEVFLFHSVLTPALNIGLLTPQDILEKTLAYAQTHAVSLNSLEGFIRQLIGWREFVRGVYLAEGVRQRNTNFWQFQRPLPEPFWQGTTGLLPFDTLVRKLERHAYSHHIERLMVAGSLFLLCEFRPDDVYRWFMEWYIDAYDWVMVPNVYGMSLYADGGLITTKPYLCGSNYILKMSDFPKGDWCRVWDGLYWRFIWQHQDFFKQSPRMSMMANLVNKMDKKVLAEHLKVANVFLESL
jgi:deoxyribodipyrimidine photolyase-related protein